MIGASIRQFSLMLSVGSIGVSIRIIQLSFILIFQCIYEIFGGAREF